MGNIKDGVLHTLKSLLPGYRKQHKDLVERIQADWEPTEQGVADFLTTAYQLLDINTAWGNTELVATKLDDLTQKYSNKQMESVAGTPENYQTKAEEAQKTVQAQIDKNLFAPDIKTRLQNAASNISTQQLIEHATQTDFTLVTRDVRTLAAKGGIDAYKSLQAIISEQEDKYGKAEVLVPVEITREWEETKKSAFLRLLADDPQKARQMIQDYGKELLNICATLQHEAQNGRINLPFYFDMKEHGLYSLKEKAEKKWGFVKHLEQMANNLRADTTGFKLFKEQYAQRHPEFYDYMISVTMKFAFAEAQGSEKPKLYVPRMKQAIQDIDKIITNTPDYADRLKEEKKEHLKLAATALIQNIDAVFQEKAKKEALPVLVKNWAKEYITVTEGLTELAQDEAVTKIATEITQKIKTTTKEHSYAHQEYLANRNRGPKPHRRFVKPYQQKF